MCGPSALSGNGALQCGHVRTSSWVTCPILGWRLKGAFPYSETGIASLLSRWGIVYPELLQRDGVSGASHRLGKVNPASRTNGNGPAISICVALFAIYLLSGNQACKHFRCIRAALPRAGHPLASLASLRSIDPKKPNAATAKIERIAVCHTRMAIDNLGHRLVSEGQESGDRKKQYISAHNWSLVAWG